MIVGVVIHNGNKRKADCLHCGKFRWQCGRGLCKGCYSQSDIAEKYPLLKLSGRSSEPPSPTRVPSPTTALPGSEEKVKILQERLWAGEYLWHPSDSNSRAVGETEQEPVTRHDLQPSTRKDFFIHNNLILQILAMLDEGYGRGEIARQLGISREEVSRKIWVTKRGKRCRVVKCHISNDASNRAHVVRGGKICYGSRIY